MADGAAPDWPDIAFTMKFESDPASVRSYPIVVGREALVVVNASYGPSTLVSSPSHPAVVYAIDLDDPRLVRVVARPAWPIHALASDGTNFYAVGTNAVTAWPLSGGEPVWGPHPIYAVRGEEPRATSPQESSCAPPAVHAGVVYVACGDGPEQRAAAVVVEAFRAEDGTRLWADPFVSHLAAPPDVPCTDAPSQECILGPLYSAAAGRDPFWAIQSPGASGISVIGDNLFVPVRTAADGFGDEAEPAGGAFSGYTLYAIGAADGKGRILDHDWNPQPPTGNPARRFAIPTGTDDWLFVRGYDLESYSLDDVQFGRQHEARNLWGPGPDGASDAIAVANGRVYTTDPTTMHAYTLTLDDPAGWTPFDLPADEIWSQGPILAVADIVCARSNRPQTYYIEGPTRLHCMDGTTGAHRWTHPFEEPVMVAATDGAFVSWSRSGQLTVLGSTAASLRPDAAVNTLFPDPAKTVTVDQSSSAPGYDGPPTEFRADWGDGTMTEWQAAPIFTHRFLQPIDAHARFYVRNDANQTASIPMTFHVGQKDPAMNILNSPFSDDYQETSFFILGLLVTGVAATFGIYRTGRKRRRFEEELRALEDECQHLNADTPACDAMLARRKSAARALFLEKRLEEAHTSFLIGRIDELRRGLRLGDVEERLAFLPHGMVVHLQKMLADAHVDAWERKNFLEALDHERDLSSAQRGTVRKLIDSWFARDVQSRP